MRARWKVLDLTMKDSGFQFKKILFFYIILLDFNTLGPAFLQYQYSFPEVEVLKAVEILIYGPLNFFIACDGVSRNKFLQVWEKMEVWGCQIRRIGGMAKQIIPQILQFSHCQYTFVSRYVVLVKDDVFLQVRPLFANFDIQSVKKVRVIFTCNCSAFFKVIN